MKKAKTVCLCLSLVIGVCNLSAANAITNTDIIRNDSTGILDRALYKLILEKGDNNGDNLLSKAEANAIYRLEGDPYLGINNLKGIEHLENLLYLRLQSNSIKNLEPLRTLKKLTELDLSYNQISEILPLDNLTGLRQLELKGNQISDLFGIKNLINLEYLDLSENKISDISELRNLSKMLNIYLEDNQITDIGALSEMSNLYSLWLGDNLIKDLNVISGLKKLKGLNIDNNVVDNLDAIETLTELEMLFAENNYISKLPNMQNHNKLDIRNTFLADNMISEAELKSKLPNSFITNQEWIDENKNGVLEVTNLNAFTLVNGHVSLYWDYLSRADGYKIYRRIGNGQYKYLASVSDTAYTDETASLDEYNYYRVYPYRKKKDGTVVIGNSANYAYAKGIIIGTSGIKLNAEKRIITVGKVSQLKATVLPNGANQKVTWRTGNPKTATVDQTGKVTAKSVGLTWLYAKTVDGKEAKALIKVIPQPIDVKLNYSSKIVTLGKATQFKATVNPTGANQAVTWRSDNPKVASIDQNGMVSARAVGNATIYAQTVNGKEIKAAVKVIPQPKAVKLNSEKQEIKQGATYTFKATVNPTNANQAVTWRIGNTKIAKVDKSGKVTALSEGLTWLYAKTVNGLEVRALVKVIKK